MQTETFTSGESDHLTVAVLTSVVSLVLALMYFIARTGFSNPPVPIIVTLSIAWFLLCSPTALRWVLFRYFQDKVSDIPLLSIGILILFSLGVLTLLGLLSALIPSLNLSYSFLILGPVCLLITVFRWLLHPDHISIKILLIVGSGLFAIWVGSTIWGSNYHSNLYLEKLVSGSPIIDTLFHASISSTIKTYGIPSTGLHGTPYLPYHAGSHWIFAQISRLLHLNSLTFYMLGYPIIFIPFFFYAVLFSSAAIRNSSSGLEPDHLPKLQALFSFLAFVTMQIWNEISDYQLISESYMMSLSVLLLTLGLVVSFLKQQPFQSGRLRTYQSIFIALLGLPLLIGLQGVLKISVMAVFLGVVFYFFARWGLYRRPVAWLLVTIILVIAGAVYRIGAPAEAANANGDFIPFSLYRVRRALEEAATHSTLTWIFVITKIGLYQALNRGTLWTNFKRNRFTDVEAVVVFTIVGAMPFAIVKLGVYYFTNIHHWIASLFLLANIPLFFKLIERLREKYDLYRNSKIVPVVVTGLLVSWSALLILAAQRSVQRYIADNSTVRQAFYADSTYELLQTLAEIGDKPETEKRDSLLYIPSRSSIYWDSFDIDCIGVPFIAPSLSGIAMLNGLPDPSRCHNDTFRFGYISYQGLVQPTISGQHDRLSENVLCEDAISMGYSNVIILENKEDHLTIEEIICLGQ
jgi:hypothetical protein